MKFLAESSVVPAGALTNNREKLPLPSVQEADEYRVYHNKHKEMQYSTDEDGNDIEEEVTVYDYVSVLCDHEPSDDEWRELLTERGYSNTAINKILTNR